MSSTPRTARQTHPYRKVIIIFSILVSLFLLGTVIVLSSVSYYLAIPDGAFLTEEEVPWTGDDHIASLKEPVSVPEVIDLGKRQEWEEVTGEGAVLGAETIPEVWDELAEEALPVEGVEPVASYSSPSEAADVENASYSSVSDVSDEGSWGIDGKGSGAYWMKEDWDGVVRDSSSWDRLYNVTTRSVSWIERFASLKLTLMQAWGEDSSYHSPDLEDGSAA